MVLFVIQYRMTNLTQEHGKEFYLNYMKQWDVIRVSLRLNYQVVDSAFRKHREGERRYIM